MIKFTISWQLKPLGHWGESVSHLRGSVRIIVKWLNHPIQTAEASGISSSFITINTPIYIRANRKSHAPNNVIGASHLKAFPRRCNISANCNIHTSSILCRHKLLQCHWLKLYLCSILHCHSKKWVSQISHKEPRIYPRGSRLINPKKKKNLDKKLTSMSPLGMPSNSEGLIQPSTTSHPPKFTALTLESPRNPST